jgi:serine/threonine-protein kinase
MIEFGAYRYDSESRLLYRGDEEILLPPRVVAVLESLLKRPGKIVPKEDLLASAWEGAFVGEDSLTQAISQLRQALGDDPQRPIYIQTIPRRGYRLIAAVSEPLRGELEPVDAGGQRSGTSVRRGSGPLGRGNGVAESVTPGARGGGGMRAEAGELIAAATHGASPAPPFRPLAPGLRLGRYEVVARVGAGAMGEVWEARDTELDRAVAIKVVPADLGADPRVMERFRREAKMLAAVNHPNIATIFGVEEVDGTRLIAMELLRGKTLEQRLEEGPLPIADALAIALQVAEALEAAHERGIIHRDLKPANVVMTSAGPLKVVDFGLAKSLPRRKQGLSGSNAVASQPDDATQRDSTGLTASGVVLGTAPYMSPEQVRGEPADKRADIWAFGCLLYEMLTGARAFRRESVAETLAAILDRDPDWERLPADIPAPIRRLLHRCLAKQPRNRLHDIADARIEIEAALAEPERPDLPDLAAATFPTTAAAAPRAKLLQLALWALAGVLLGSLATWYLLPRARPYPPTHSVETLPLAHGFRNTGRPVVAFSPDGSRFVYNTVNGLYLRYLDDPEARLIPGTEEALANPFFSPDGKWVGYFSIADQQLKKVSVQGGRPLKLCDTAIPFGASWESDGTILFGRPDGVMKCPDGGGTAELLVGAQPGEAVHGPQMLPDGNTVLFTLTRVAGPFIRWDEAEIVVQALDTGERKTLLRDGADARYVPTGHLVYALGDVLYAVPFDLDRLEVTAAAPTPIVEGVQRAGGPSTSTPSANWGFSHQGALLYLARAAWTANLVLALVDQEGTERRLNAPPASYRNPRVSPDGSAVAVETSDENGGAVWIYDLSESAAIRRLATDGDSYRPVWTPDGKRVTFASHRDGTQSIYWQAADGGDGAERLTNAEEGSYQWPESWSPDGRTLAFTKERAGEHGIWTLALNGAREPQLFHDVPLSREGGPRFSPDGKWIAYHSAEDTGSPELYIKPFPPTSFRQQFTSGGGLLPVWSPDSRGLYYRLPPGASSAGPLMRIEVTTAPVLTFRGERMLSFGESRLSLPGGSWLSRDYDVMPDGERFLMVVPTDPAGEDSHAQIHIVLNWFEELKTRVPTGSVARAEQ